jgi:hypothetical protein
VRDRDVIRVGVISNPRSRQNLRGMAAIRELLARHPQILHREIASRAENAAVVRDLAAAGVELVVINGGDGTVQGVLTEIINGGQFATLPKLAVLPTGMTNLVAADVGLPGRPVESLARLIALTAGGQSLPEVRRAVISMRHAADQPPAHGLFFGGAAFYRGTVMGRDQVHRIGVQKSLAAGLSLFWFLFLAFFSRTGRNPLYRGEAMTVRIDGSVVPEPEQFVLLGTTLHCLILGMMPFWGDGPGSLRYTSVAFPLRRFARALVPLLRGRPRPWMNGSGYRSGRAREIALVTDCPIVMDGEIFPTSRDTPVLLRADREVAFVRV